MDYLVLLPMVWSAVSMQVAGAAVSLFVTAQIANALHAWGRGPFAGSALVGIQGSIQLQVFLATAGVTVLLLACRTAESERFHDLAAARHHLIAAVSHELRTPLTPIVGLSELLLRRTAALDRDTQRGLEVIQRNGQHLVGLVDDLLRVSRGHQGSVPVHPEVVDIAAVLQELRMARPGDALEIAGDTDAGTAWVDRTHLIQIVTNLLDNALRHGRPPVSVGVHREDDHLLVRVRDQGDGVPEWFLPELFEEFAQATSGDRRPSLGLGLGLPIARSLARANGGSSATSPRRTEPRSSSACRPNRWRRCR